MKKERGGVNEMDVRGHIQRTANILVIGLQMPAHKSVLRQASKPVEQRELERGRRTWGESREKDNYLKKTREKHITYGISKGKAFF